MIALPPHRRGRRAAVVPALMILLALLAGCSKQALYSQLSERQANEMVAVLQGAGIDAEKETQEGQFSVLTTSADFPRAVRTLSAQGYPRETFDTIGTVFKKEGFVSTPLEERARLVHAMSQEIAGTLTRIDCVVTARVHLVLPERHPLIDKVQPAAAAVFIKHRPDCDLAPQVTQIKALVVNSVEGLAYDNVTVALFPAEGATAEVPPPDVRPAQQAGAALPLLPLMLLGSGAGTCALAGGGLLWWRRRRAPARPALPAPAASPAALPDTFDAALRRRTTAAE